MQYMHFNSSCSFCGVANLLELQGREVTDVALFQAMRADILLHYEEKDGHWQIGAMLQSGCWFDLALIPMGFHLEEYTAKQEEIAYTLPPPFMVGLKMREGKGRHAHVLTERDGDRMIFLNPHRKNDGEEDLVVMTQEECICRLMPFSTVGRLASCTPKETDFEPLMAQSKKNWMQYQREWIAFTAQPHVREELLTLRDSFFRALLLDALEGARICGHREQEQRLELLQCQFMNSLKQEGPILLSKILDNEAVQEAFKFYIAS